MRDGKWTEMTNIHYLHVWNYQMIKSFKEMKNIDHFEDVNMVFINNRKETGGGKEEILPVNTPCSVLAYEYPLI